MALREDTSLRRSLTSILAPKRIHTLAQQLGVVRRQRKVDIVALVYTLALGFSVGNRRSLAGLRRAYERATGTTLAPSAFYDRFTDQLAQLLEQLAVEALSKLERRRRRLSGTFQAFQQVLAVDSTLLRLHNALEEAFPSVWTNYMRASAKLNVVMNVVGRGAKRLQLAAGRTHDMHLLRPGRWMRGKLLIADLAYFQSEMFTAIGQHGGWFLCKLKAHTNPFIVASHQRAERWLEGYNLQNVLPYLEGDTADFDGEIPFRIKWGWLRGRGWRKARFRVVGVRNEQTGELHWYATNAPREHLHPKHIAALYAARWEVELLFRELKSHYRIGQLPTRRRAVTECLIYAALITVALGRRLRQWVAQRRPKHASRLTTDRFAVLLACFARDVLDVLLGPRALRAALARKLKRVLLHEAVDPNLSRLPLPERAQRGVLQGQGPGA
jgi:IS4 transposase